MKMRDYRPPYAGCIFYLKYCSIFPHQRHHKYKCLPLLVTVLLLFSVVLPSLLACIHDATTHLIACTSWFMQLTVVCSTRIGFCCTRRGLHFKCSPIPLAKNRSFIHATSTLFNISSLQDAFWKGATLDAVKESYGYNIYCCYS